MRNFVFLLVLLISSSGCTFIQEDAGKFIIDSNYAKYKQREAAIEKSYLDEEIDYSEYRAKMNELEQDRLKSEQEREEILFK